MDDDPAGLGRMAFLCSSINLGVHLRVLKAESLELAFELLAANHVHLILLDKDFSNQRETAVANGIESIPSLLAIQPLAQVLVVTSSTAAQDAARAMSLGAFWFLSKDTPDSLVVAQIEKALTVAELARLGACQARKDLPTSLELPGTSVAIKLLQARIRAVAETSRPILLCGETGTGKTTVARQIHEQRQRNQGRKDAPFFAVNMGAISPELAERELFGNEKGAFTDAKEARPGIFELAHGGTLFLDEIGEAPLDLQVKLLKVIEEGTFIRIGGSQPRSTALKLICATNRNLEEQIAAGRFREDLYFRISTFPLTITPLRDRREDIPAVIRAVLPKSCAESNVQVTYEDLPQDFLEAVMSSPLRGNVREVEQHLARLLVYAPRDRAGRPVLDKWRETSALSTRKGSTAASARAALKLKDFHSLPFDVINADFPGMDAFLDIVRDKVIRNAMEKHSKLKDMGEILKVSIGRISPLRRRLLGLEGAP